MSQVSGIRHGPVISDQQTNDASKTAGSLHGPGTPHESRGGTSSHEVHQEALSEEASSHGSHEEAPSSPPQFTSDDFLVASDILCFKECITEFEKKHAGKTPSLLALDQLGDELHDIWRVSHKPAKGNTRNAAWFQRAFVTVATKDTAERRTVLEGLIEGVKVEMLGEQGEPSCGTKTKPSTGVLSQPLSGIELTGPPDSSLHSASQNFPSLASQPNPWGPM